MIVYVDVNLLEELEEEVRRLMNHYVANPVGSDYCCEFCAGTGEGRDERVRHRDDCNGTRYLREISLAKSCDNGPTRV